MNIDVSRGDRLKIGLRVVSEEGARRHWQVHILFSNFKMIWLGEHCGIVILLLSVLILQSDDFEGLTTDLAPVNGPFSSKVEHFFMSVRLILHTWTHANDDSPRTVRGEDKNWVINSSELTVHSVLHFMPGVQLQGLLSDRCREILSSISMKPVAIWQLRFKVLSVWLEERLQMPVRLIESIFQLVSE